MKTTLTNELGNTIDVEVAEAPPVGGVPMVLITLSGPDSLSENLVTRAEAEALFSLLGRVLQT